jgi:CYTH domain-containing protein
MTSHYEIERRWKLKRPLSPEAIHQIVAHTSDIQYITQIYLKGSNHDQTERIRTISRDFFGNNPEFYHTKKVLVENGVNKEDEKQISEVEYKKLLEKADPKKEPITKIRYVFDYNDQKFEMDIFPKRDGLMVLELELKSKQQPIELPSYLEVEREITDEKHYRNYMLANKDWAEFGPTFQSKS